MANQEVADNISVTHVIGLANEELAEGAVNSRMSHNGRYMLMSLEEQDQSGQGHHDGVFESNPAVTDRRG